MAGWMGKYVWKVKWRERPPGSRERLSRAYRLHLETARIASLARATGPKAASCKRLEEVPNWSVTIDSTCSETGKSGIKLNGATYWDNNGGQDYRLADYQFDALLTYPDISGATGQRDTTKSAIVGNILVKNRGTQKAVTVKYTDNAWATTKTATATYVATLPSGVEYWAYEAPVSASAPSSNLQLSFVYTHAQGTATDDNYGRYYRVVSNTVTR